MSLWYRTGTINLTNGSTALTGTGTAWVANVSPGMMVVYDRQIIGEVQSVNSNTSITLAVAYAGTTISGGAYAIANLGAVRDGLIAAVNDALAVFQAAQDGPLSGRFGDGTLSEPGLAFLADLNTGFRRPAADQIGMVTGGVQRALLSSAGLNAVTNLLLNGSQVFARSNLLGTVSQSGGVPTGAGIEPGSNANGDYVRFADGTQICWHTLTTGAINVAEGAGYSASAATNWTYPAGFASGTLPGIFGASPNLGRSWLAPFSSTNSACSVLPMRFISTASASQFIAVALGRWF
ncbi:hypothetical protein [uncultured Roseovarius sp.]|uniref:hypothetical protein n=1 Tax=uncultured Roseovarius sp. TaxID=293344 RepID=UPI000C416AB6|nr:hypothetical protein [Roseovarius sp.]MBD11561.1 hypothetical protein [Roseovarius sp.]|tara:strand:+ start:85 stop:963 length:879 start_codon:yes stop_codon:yes gene_type:complete